jgi:hypothetical protein
MYTLADIYRGLRQEFNIRREINYIYHTNRLENSYLPRWATEKVLTAALLRKSKRFREKDILAAQNHPRAIKYVRERLHT